MSHKVLQNKFVIHYQIFDSFNKPKDTKDMKNTFEALNDPEIQYIKA